jgi:hypothetical protein
VLIRADGKRLLIEKVERLEVRRDVGRTGAEPESQDFSDEGAIV